MCLFTLTYLAKEEEIKTKLNKMIRERKKTIYSSLMTTIEKTMQECYESKIEDQTLPQIHIYIIIIV